MIHVLHQSFVRAENPDMNKDEILIQKRLSELSKTAFHRGMITFSDFLNLNDQQLLHQLPKDTISTAIYLFGGYIPAERCKAAFIPDEATYLHGFDSSQFQHKIYGASSNEIPFASSLDFPIRCLLIQPLQKKFAEPLTHRDYLGALLNLGIERHKTGDILVGEDQAHIFVDSGICDFICENFIKIRHTSVKAVPALTTDLKYEANLKSLKGNVASVRLDSLIGLVYNLARGKASSCIESGKVFVNNRLISSNSYKPQENDIISVRGLGRFAYRGITAETRKGRYFVELDKYI